MQAVGQQHSQHRRRMSPSALLGDLVGSEHFSSHAGLLPEDFGPFVCYLFHLETSCLLCPSSFVYLTPVHSLDLSHWSLLQARSYWAKLFVRHIQSALYFSSFVVSITLLIICLLSLFPMKAPYEVWWWHIVLYP